MKKAALALILTALLATLAANPVVIDSGLLGVWFDAYGDFWMAYEPVEYAPQAFEDMHEMAIYTDSGAYQLPEDWMQTYIGGGYNICHVNLSQTIPGFAINRQADTFSLLNVPYPSSLTWGEGSGYAIDLQPLTGEQAAAYVHYSTGGFDEYQVWAKSASYQDFYSDSNRKCKVTLNIRDESGHPVNNYPFKQYFGNPSYGQIWTYYTDSEGNCHFDSYATRYLFRVEDPESGEIYAEPLLYPEPGDSLWVQATIPCQHGQPDLPGVLEIRPNLLNRFSSCRIRLIYDKYWNLGSDARVALYDLRGRELLGASFPLSGQLDWLLPDLPNGIYFIGLAVSGKHLASQRLTIIK